MTLIELMVVFAIISVVAWIGFGLIGVLRGTDPLESAEAVVRGVVTRGRAFSVASASRFTLMVDYQGNRLVPLERKPVATFSFESDLGSFGRFAAFANGAGLTRNDVQPIASPFITGGAAMVPGGGLVRIPFLNEFTRDAGSDGIAVQFSIFPEPSGAESGVLVSSGTGAWRIEAETLSSGVVQVSATVGSFDVIGTVPLTPWQWNDVDFILSPVLIQLSVNGVTGTTSTARLSEEFELPDVIATEVQFGSPNCVPMTLDEVRVESVSLGEFADLGRAILLPPFVRPLTAAEGGDRFSAATGVTTAIPPPLALAPPDSYDPSFGIPRRALVFFDRKGQLDSTFHAGSAVIHLVALTPEGDVQQMEVSISPMGVVTGKRVAPRPLGQPLDELLDPAAGGS